MDYLGWFLVSIVTILTSGWIRKANNSLVPNLVPIIDLLVG